MRRLVVVSALAAIAVLGTASPTLACAPSTFDDDGFGLERGIAWAFEGRVAREIVGEAGQGPAAVIIEVDRTLIGEASGSELSIAADTGCDGFWYGLGDAVIVAIPQVPGWLAEPGPADRLRPPYANVTNSLVAVWVLDGDRVVPGDGPHSWPTIGGVHPRSAADVIDALVALPDTATGASVTSVSRSAVASHAANVLSALPLVLGVAAFVLVLLAGARSGSPSHVAGRRRTP